MQAKNKALFISFEGIDGTGKTTQIHKVADYIASKGYEYIVTRDPGGTDLGTKLRDILLNYDGVIYPKCELLLYVADRAQHVDEKIRPALGQGQFVLCDRYVDSSLAYQGYARGINHDQILNLNLLATDGLMPDLTFVLDIDVNTSFERVGKQKDRLESEAADFFEKVRNGYLDLAAKYPERIRVIDATVDVDAVFEQILTVLKEYIG